VNTVPRRKRNSIIDMQKRAALEHTEQPRLFYAYTNPQLKEGF
jgi:hypothetical protein